MNFIANLMVWYLGLEWKKLTEQIHFLRREIKLLKRDLSRVQKEIVDEEKGFNWSRTSIVYHKVEERITPFSRRIRSLSEQLMELEDERRSVRMNRINWKNCKSPITHLAEMVDN